METEVKEVQEQIEKCADEIKVLLRPMLDKFKDKDATPPGFYALAMCFLAGGIMASHKTYKGKEVEGAYLAGKLFTEGANSFLKFTAERKKKQ